MQRSAPGVAWSVPTCNRREWQWRGQGARRHERWDQAALGAGGAGLGCKYLHQVLLGLSPPATGSSAIEGGERCERWGQAALGAGGIGLKCKYLQLGLSPPATAENGNGGGRGSDGISDEARGSEGAGLGCAYLHRVLLAPSPPAKGSGRAMGGMRHEQWGQAAPEEGVANLG